MTAKHNDSLEPSTLDFGPAVFLFISKPAPDSSQLQGNCLRPLACGKILGVLSDCQSIEDIYLSGLW